MQTSTRRLMSALEDFSPRLIGKPGTLSFLSIQKLGGHSKGTVDPGDKGTKYFPVGAAARLPLYITRLSALQALDELPPAAAFVCLSDGDIGDGFSLVQDAPLILLENGGIHTDALVSRVVECVMDSHRYDALMDLLVDALASNKDLAHILQLCYYYFGTHLSVVNSSYRFLAHTFTPELIRSRGEFMKEATQTGYLPREVLKSMREDGALGKMQSATKAVLLQEPNNVEKLCQSLRINGSYVGQLSLYNFNRPIQEDDYQMLPVVGKFICAWLQKSNQFADDNAVPWRSFLRDLIRNPPSATVASAQLENLGIHFSDELVALRVVSSEQERLRKNIPLHVIQQQIDTLLGERCWSIILDESIFIIADTGSEQQSHLFKKLKYFLRENQLFCGCSNVFSNIMDVKTYYAQTNTALDLGRKRVPDYYFHYYKDYMLDHMLSLCSRSTSLASMCHPALFSLRHYDQSYNTSYFSTLSTYLECNGNLSECARLLNVHYNTMKYRIKMIQSIGEIDLKSIDIMATLRLSFKILEYEDRTEPAPSPQ